MVAKGRLELLAFGYEPSVSTRRLSAFAFIRPVPLLLHVAQGTWYVSQAPRMAEDTYKFGGPSRSQTAPPTVQAW